MIAFFVMVDGFDDMAACADTLSKARYQAFKAARDAGYSVTFPGIKVTRASGLDTWAASQDKPRIVARHQAEWEVRK